MTVRRRPLARTWRSSQTVGVPPSAVKMASGSACWSISLARYCGWILPRSVGVARLSSVSIPLPCRARQSSRNCAVAALRHARQQGRRRRLDVADDAQLHGMAPAEMSGIAVDLDDARLVGIELAPREVAAQQQQRVAALHRMIAARRAQHAGHADVEGIVIFEEILGARGVGDRRLQPPGQRHDLVMGLLAAGAAIDRDLLAGVQDLGDPVELGIARPQQRRGVMDGEGRLVGRRGLGDVDRQDQHRHAALGEGRLGRHRRLAPRLRGRADLAAEHAAAPVDRFEVDLLREVEVAFLAGDLAGDQHDRRPVAVGFEQAVDEMQAARPARAGAGREVAGQQRLGAGREAADFLVAHMDPCDAAAPDRVGDVVQRVARHAPAMLDAGSLQGFDDDFGNGLAHGGAPWSGNAHCATLGACAKLATWKAGPTGV